MLIITTMFTEEALVILVLKFLIFSEVEDSEIKLSVERFFI